MAVDRRLLLAAIVAWIVVAIVSLVSGPPLGHDESAFAVAARGDAPGWLYRSTGVIELARIGLAFGGSDFALRVASVVLGAGVVIGAWAVGRNAFGDVAGAWAAAVVAGAHPIALRSAELIGDLPATAGLLVGVAILLGELQRDRGPSWRLVGAAPAFAAAFYFRYGSAPVIALACVAAAGLWWRAIVARPLPVIATVVAFLALLVPYTVHSLDATGSVFGILELSARVPRRDYIGEGLVTYLTWNPFWYYGALVAPVMVVGLVAIVRPPARWRPAIYLGTIAVGQIVVLGLTSHAQPRYIYVATILLVVLGVEAIGRYAAHGRFRIRGAAGVIVGLAWLGTLIAAVPHNRWLANHRTDVVAASAAIRADDGAGPCVIAARVVPQLVWYSGCSGFLYHPGAPLPSWPPTWRRYVVSVSHGTIVDPSPIAQSQGAVAKPMPVADTAAKLWRLE